MRAPDVEAEDNHYFFFSSGNHAKWTTDNGGNAIQEVASDKNAAICYR